MRSVGILLVFYVLFFASAVGAIRTEFSYKVPAPDLDLAVNVSTSYQATAAAVSPLLLLPNSKSGLHIPGLVSSIAKRPVKPVTAPLRVTVVFETPTVRHIGNLRETVAKLMAVDSQNVLISTDLVTDDAVVIERRDTVNV